MPQVDPRASIDAHLHHPWRERRKESGQRCCAWPGCEADGAHRAPRSRDELRAFVWFCLEHVREYNRQWDYFAGMSTAEIDAYRRADVTWHRPTWRFGGHGGSAQGGGRPHYADPFGFMDQDDAPPVAPRPVGRAAEMMALLGLPQGFSLLQLRERYKFLVKQYHPDVNQGDRAAEERLRLVIEAYRFLRDNGLYAPT